MYICIRETPIRSIIAIIKTHKIFVFAYLLNSVSVSAERNTLLSEKNGSVASLAQAT